MTREGASSERRREVPIAEPEALRPELHELARTSERRTRSEVRLGLRRAYFKPGFVAQLSRLLAASKPDIA